MRLLPPPQRIHIQPGCADCSLAAADEIRCGLYTGNSDSPDAYRLVIHPAGIIIEAASPSGAFHARQTLAQIVEQNPDSLPCVEIEDWPDYAVRGFYHDVTRGKVPTLDTLIGLANTCARYKINHLQLYIEHTFAFKNHPEVWAGADPLTAAEIRQLDAHCAKLHIDLVPSFSTFGHFYEWIHRKFHTLGELDRDVKNDPFTWFDRMAHHTLDCQNPDSIALVREIIHEVRPLFRSRYFNICADETFDLGKGRNRALAEAVGSERLYVDFLKLIMEIVRECEAIPLFWGDVVGRHPDFVNELPQDAILLDWDYSQDCHSCATEIISKLDRAFYICTGVHGWNRWIHNYSSAHSNILRFAGIGQGKAGGLLNTDWGDYGHINLLSLSTPGLILGACAAWNGKSPQLEPEIFDENVGHLEFGDPSGQLAAMLRKAGDTVKASWRTIALVQQPRPFQHSDQLFDPESGLPSGLFALDAKGHAKARETLIRLNIEMELVLANSTPRDPLAPEEIRTAMQGAIAMEGAVIALQRLANRTSLSEPSAGAVSEELLALEAALATCWAKRNKPSEYFRIREVLTALATRISA